MKLYFKNGVTIAPTVMILILIGYIAFCILTRKQTQHWGLRSLILLVYGLVVCCFAATRDGLDKTIKNAIDGSCDPGLFQLISIPNIAGCIGVLFPGGALAVIVGIIATPIAKTQAAREVWFYVMSGGITLKILTVEIARIIATLR